MLIKFFKSQELRVQMGPPVDVETRFFLSLWWHSDFWPNVFEPNFDEIKDEESSQDCCVEVGCIIGEQSVRVDKVGLVMEK